MKQVGYHLGWSDRLLLTTLFRALRVSVRRIWSREGRKGKRAAVAEESRKRRPQLTRDDQDRIECVACRLCSTVCPSGCIQIEVALAPWEDRERFPARFDLDLTRCVFCGWCAEACPSGAILMGEGSPLSAGERRGLVFDKEQLLV